MAFPTTGILSTFDDASGWSTVDHGGGSFVFTITGGAASESPTAGTRYRDGETYGDDCESYVTITVPGNGGWDIDVWGPIFTTLRLFTRLQSPGTVSVDGYSFWTGSSWASDIPGVYQDMGYMSRIDNNVYTVLGASWGTGGTQSTNLWGLTSVGNVHSVYLNSGAYGPTRTDATYPNAGYVGLGVNLITVDNFGGGTIAGAPVLSNAVLEIGEMRGRRTSW
jgi:hypothetical protein